MLVFINIKSNLRGGGAILYITPVSLILVLNQAAIMSEDWGTDDTPTVLAPQAQDIKLFGKWSTDDVQVSDISLTVSVC